MFSVVSGYRPSLGALCLALAVPCTLLPQPAFAELSNTSMVGPGVRGRPAYDGSDSQRAEIVPVVRYLGRPLFLRTTQGVLEGGARLELAPGLHAGAQIAYEPGRKTRESGFLEARNVADIDHGASIGAQLEWDYKVGPAPIAVLARIRHHTASDRGAQADLRLSVGVFEKGRVGAGVFTQVTWANAESANALYGVTPAASAATGLPAYAAGSGLLFSSVGLL